MDSETPVSAGVRPHRPNINQQLLRGYGRQLPVLAGSRRCVGNFALLRDCEFIWVSVCRVL